MRLRPSPATPASATVRRSASGLLAALRLSGQPELRAQVAGLLAARGLPVALDGVDPDAVVMATARDKKRLGDEPVALRAPGWPGLAAGWASRWTAAR